MTLNEAMKLADKVTKENKKVYIVIKCSNDFEIYENGKYKGKKKEVYRTSPL